MSSTGDDETRTAFRTCPLCEASCGLELTVQGNEIVRIRGDRDDVFSRGFLCPKGSTLKQLHDDPDRVRRPLVKRDGQFVEVSWHEAFSRVEELLVPIIAAHGRDSVAVYVGNPTAHNLSAALYGRSLIQGIGTRNRFSASTVDQAPKQVAAGYLFGTAVSVAVPDLDRTDYLLVLGANPYASNGSLCTAADFPGRLDALRARGGRLVVVDPRRSRTAEAADEWLAIRPGGDAAFLAGIAHVLVRDHLAQAGDHVEPLLDGRAALEAALAAFAPTVVATACGIEASVIERIAHELAAAPSAAVYGRIGTCTQLFGTTASWLIDVVNIFTGNLDRPGGAMFALPAAGGATTHGASGVGQGFRVGRAHSRVSALPEVMGEFPVVALAEEITTPGEGQVRALVTVAGNPVLSTPNAARLDAALGSLEAMISVDIYVNETTRHADVILPPPSNLRRSHYDLLLLQFAVRNVANYSGPVLEPELGEPDEWEILARLGLIAQGKGVDADVGSLDDAAIAGIVRNAVADPHSSVHGRDADELLELLDKAGRRGPERMLDFRLRTGPYGDAFGTRPDGLTLAILEANPHGIDFGALQPRLPEILRTRSGKIELAHPVMLADLERLSRWIEHGWRAGGSALGLDVDGSAAEAAPMVLVGRRDLRSNNSWMHNLTVLVKGKQRCTLQIHPDDARRIGVADGSSATVRSRVGRITLPVEVTTGIRVGVVSVPHGYGHDLEGVRLAVASGRAPGVNSNVLADHEAIDPLSGNAVLNGIPVVVERATPDPRSIVPAHSPDGLPVG